MVTTLAGSVDPITKELKQTSNFVRDFGFNTKIDPSLASMITIGSTAEGVKTKNYDGTAFSKWNDGLRDRFSYDFDNPEEPPLIASTIRFNRRSCTFNFRSSIFFGNSILKAKA